MAKKKTEKKQPTLRGARVSSPLVDTPMRLLDDIKERRIDPATITRTQRQACLLLIANGKHTSAELAELFRVSPSMIRADLKVLRETVGREVGEWSLNEVLGQLYMAKERCSATAMKQDDPALAWTVERDFAKLLIDLGVVGKKESGEGWRITVEQIGQGYDRATALLGQAISPALTGEVVSKDENEAGTGDEAKTLPLDRRLHREEEESSLPPERDD